MTPESVGHANVSRSPRTARGIRQTRFRVLERDATPFEDGAAANAFIVCWT
jgi:hypothetical protein